MDKQDRNENINVAILLVALFLAYCVAGTQEMNEHLAAENAELHEIIELRMPDAQDAPQPQQAQPKTVMVMEG